MNLKERFTSKVNITNGCWLWTGTLRGKCGYGCLKVNGRVVSSHRLSYELFNGKIPKGMLVCHTCDNRKCVKPDHLFLGTYKENYNDAKKKGRVSVPDNPQLFKPGEGHVNSKLCNKDIQNIRKRHGNGESMRKLGEKYGVHYTLVGMIVRRERWKHVK